MALPAESRVGIRPVSIKYLALLRNSAIHYKVGSKIDLFVSLSSYDKEEIWGHQRTNSKAASEMIRHSGIGIPSGFHLPSMILTKRLFSDCVLAS